MSDSFYDLEDVVVAVNPTTQQHQPCQPCPPCFLGRSSGDNDNDGDNNSNNNSSAAGLETIGIIGIAVGIVLIVLAILRCAASRYNLLQCCMARLHAYRTADPFAVRIPRNPSAPAHPSADPPRPSTFLGFLNSNANLRGPWPPGSVAPTAPPQHPARSNTGERVSAMRAVLSRGEQPHQHPGNFSLENASESTPPSDSSYHSAIDPERYNNTEREAVNDSMAHFVENMDERTRRL
ncbi:uncharacterized protein LOC129583432 isoform X2 [Paramacrobiotus metropolitanus]|uniref:uncharacterized protein LOC129583432 isoform X2 n=1 Tax=Paramacrobiotus metropolitanus TaxID=2943436 RepID=UPI00244647DE|nr:uncharacterized protein LOC129583432 isoform X2 [Paramacrobiotus metropolitanus]